MDSGLEETESRGVPAPDVGVNVVVGSSGVWLMMSQGIRHDGAEARSHIYCHHLATCVCCSVRVPGCDCGPRGDGDGSGDPTDPVHQLIHCDFHNSVCSGCWESTGEARCNRAHLRPLVWQCWGQTSSSQVERALAEGLWTQEGQHSGALGTGPGPTLETKRRKGERSWGRGSRQTELHPACSHSSRQGHSAACL